LSQVAAIKRDSSYEDCCLAGVGATLFRRICTRAFADWVAAEVDAVAGGGTGAKLIRLAVHHVYVRTSRIGASLNTRRRIRITVPSLLRLMLAKRSSVSRGALPGWKTALGMYLEVDLAKEQAAHARLFEGCW